MLFLVLMLSRTLFYSISLPLVFPTKAFVHFQYLFYDLGVFERDIHVNMVDRIKYEFFTL